MAIYDFHCREHGIIEMFQPMKNAASKLPCPSCGKMMDRVWNLFEMTGQLPTRYKKMGENRTELFRNLAAEGIANKDWKDADMLRSEQVITAREKMRD